MRSKNRKMINPLSLKRICRIIRSQGLQTHLFDQSLLVLDWDGLEYQFHVKESRLFLHQIVVRMDVKVGSFKSLAEGNIWMNPADTF